MTLSSPLCDLSVCLPVIPTLETCRAKAVLARITLWKEKGIAVEAIRFRDVRSGCCEGNRMVVPHEAWGCKYPMYWMRM